MSLFMSLAPLFSTRIIKQCQPLRLKDAEDIGWFVWRAKWFSDVQASVLKEGRIL